MERGGEKKEERGTKKLSDLLSQPQKTTKNILLSDIIINQHNPFSSNKLKYFLLLRIGLELNFRIESL